MNSVIKCIYLLPRFTIVFIVIKCIEDKTYHFNPFKVYDLVVLSTLTSLCSYHHHPAPGLFHLPKPKLCVHSTITTHIPSSQLLMVTVYCPSFNLTTLGTSYKWNPIIFDLFP